jgi:predicted GNAT superfamily acetyltransferase
LVLEITEASTSASPLLEDGLLSLNNTHARELSYLDAAAFRILVRHASVAWRIGLADALLIAFDHGAVYDNPNFCWFQTRHEHFLYIDRVVVAATARGRGYARKLYEELFLFALENGHKSIVCEVNLSPPNPASDAFHHSMGFTEVGMATIHNGAKTVRYFKLDVGVSRRMGHPPLRAAP